MAWYHEDRKKLLAPYGEYRPSRVTVTVHDTFDQRRLDAAATAALGWGTRLAKFLLYAADYTIRHKPELAEIRREFEAERRELQAQREAEQAREKEERRLRRNQEARERRQRRKADMIRGDPGRES